MAAFKPKKVMYDVRRDFGGRNGFLIFIISDEETMPKAGGLEI